MSPIVEVILGMAYVCGALIMWAVIHGGTKGDECE